MAAESKKKSKSRSKSKKKKITITEEDISLLLRRYSAATIVTLLQEIAQFPDTKMDWNELVKKTSTGIKNAREYQMVWRYLAYGGTFLETVDDGAVPLEDDSDLESDLEAFPPASGEASAEAAACAKVILGSCLPSDCGSPNHSTIEAPLTVNIPTGCASSANRENPESACTHAKNIIVPVSVEGLPLPTMTCTKGFEGSRPAGGGLPARKKRKPWKPWTDEEDMELIAAVRKFGEKNWAKILRGDFNGERTASQLSQRWTIIKKHQANLYSGRAGNPANSQLTEEQLATRRAVSHALNMPMLDNLLAACSAGNQTGLRRSTIPSSSARVPSGPEDTSPTIPSSSARVTSGPDDISPGCQVHVPHYTGLLNSTSKSGIATVTVNRGPSNAIACFPLFHQMAGNPTGLAQSTIQSGSSKVPTGPEYKPPTVPSNSARVPSGPEDTSPGCQVQVSCYKGTLNMAPMSGVATVTAKKGPSTPFKSFLGPNPLVQAAAVAAGGRIATPSIAASLRKAAQSKNAVHIRPGGISMIKKAIPVVTKSSSSIHLRSHPNVRHIRSGLASASAPTPTPAPTTAMYPSADPCLPQPGSSQKEHGNATRLKMVTCSFPLSTASSTLSFQQMTSTSSSAALSGDRQQEHGNFTRPQMVTCSLPLKAASSTLPCQQMTSTSSSPSLTSCKQVEPGNSTRPHMVTCFLPLNAASSTLLSKEMISTSYSAALSGCSQQEHGNSTGPQMLTCSVSLNTASSTLLSQQMTPMSSFVAWSGCNQQEHGNSPRPQIGTSSLPLNSASSTSPSQQMTSTSSSPSLSSCRQQEHGNSARPQMVSCSLPLITASTTLPSQQMTPTSYSAALLGCSQQDIGNSTRTQMVTCSPLNTVSSTLLSQQMTSTSYSAALSGCRQQEDGNSTRPQLVTCSLPLKTASSTLPSQQMTSTSSSADLYGTDKGMVSYATSIVDTKLFSKEDVKSEEMIEKCSKIVSEELGISQTNLTKIELFLENQTNEVKSLNHLYSDDAVENKQLLVLKQSESSSAIKTDACSTAMDVD